MRVVATLAITAIGLCSAAAETVQVLGRGPVDLQHFICEEAPHSAIRRVCYDEENQYMIIQLGSLARTMRHGQQLTRPCDIVGAGAMGSVAITTLLQRCALIEVRNWQI